MCFKPLVVYWKLCFIKIIQCYRKIPTMLLAVDGFLLFSTRFLFLLIWNWKTNILFLLYFLFFCFFGLFSFFRLNLLLCACSTCFLMGPFNQIKKMFASTRVIATIIVIVSLILTLVAAIVVRFLFLFFIWLFYFFYSYKIDLLYRRRGVGWSNWSKTKTQLNYSREIWSSFKWMTWICDSTNSYRFPSQVASIIRSKSYTLFGIIRVQYSTSVWLQFDYYSTNSTSSPKLGHLNRLFGGAHRVEFIATGRKAFSAIL